MQKKENNGVFLLIVLFLGVVLVLFFPKIHNFLSKTNLPKIEKTKETNVIEKKEITQDVLDEIHTPIMRNGVYSDFTYYSLDTFKITDMSNQDILYNAFMDMYKGNITDSNYNSACSNLDKEFNSKYLDLRIKNILGRNLNYTLESFSVPEDGTSEYVGNWIYKNNTFYYDGLCTKNISKYKFYDIESMIDAKYVEDDIVVTYYVGFVKVDGDNYTIYSDPKMTKIISNGVGTDYKEAFDNLDNNLKKKYQYTYKNILCTYDEYCLYEGKWL